jgi:hypothetical protein
MGEVAKKVMVNEKAAQDNEERWRGHCDLNEDVDIIMGLAIMYPWWISKSFEVEEKDASANEECMKNQKTSITRGV